MMSTSYFRLLKFLVILKFLEKTAGEAPEGSLCNNSRNTKATISGTLNSLHSGSTWDLKVSPRRTTKNKLKPFRIHMQVWMYKMSYH